MKDWIRNKLIAFLGIDALENRLENRLIEENRELRHELKELNRLNKEIIQKNKYILKQFNISADINHYDNHSWAVISIQGNTDYVRFVNLSNQDIRHVHEFLKQFEMTNRAIDSPLKFLKF